jgi:hypothetical protein
MDFKGAIWGNFFPRFLLFALDTKEARLFCGILRYEMLDNIQNNGILYL